MNVERHIIPPGHRLHPLREKDVTSSTVGALFGVDPYKTAYQLWAEKAGLVGPPEQNAAMQLGSWCEPAVAAAFRERHPRIDVGYPLGLYLHDPELRTGGTPDATAIDREQPDELICLEFKFISKWSYENASWADGLAPPGYMAQTLWNSRLLGASRGILVALVYPTAELVERPIPRHAGAEAAIERKIREFWKAFDEGHAPQPPDFGRDDEVIRQVFRPDSDRPAPIDLSANNRIREILEQREILKVAEKAANQEAKKIEAEIIAALDGSEAGMLPGWKITNKMQHRDEHVQPAADFPRLLISRQKEKAAWKD